MDRGRGRLVNIILGIILVVSLGLLFLENAAAITGHASEGYTTSNVTISKYFSILMSDELSVGIQFGTVNTLNVQDVNATENYDANNQTLYYINVSTDSNTAVDFCISASGNMEDPIGGGNIGLDNETYHAINETSDINNPSPASQVALTTSYARAVNNTSPGNQNNWRFWLDIPAAQEAGTYNNTVSFRGIQTGQVSC